MSILVRWRQKTEASTSARLGHGRVKIAIPLDSTSMACRTSVQCRPSLRWLGKCCKLNVQLLDIQSTKSYGRKVSAVTHSETGLNRTLIARVWIYFSYSDSIKLPTNMWQRVSNGTLTIENIQRQSDQGTYTCTAKNKHNYTSQKSVEVKVLGEFTSVYFPRI